MSKPTMVSLDWVLNQLAGKEFPGQGRAYDFILSSWEAGQKADFQNVYDPQYGDDRLCTCGHPYARHFDSYDDNASVGCKYCPAYAPGTFTADAPSCPNGFTQADQQSGQQHPNKRDRRREERERAKGPERKILSFQGGTMEAPEVAILECGHEIRNPPIQKTTRMLVPKVYRCVQCKTQGDQNVPNIE